MGTDFYYISATQTLSSVPILNVKSDSTIRYNREFIKVLTTTLLPSTTTGTPTLTLPPRVTTKPTGPEVSTTTAVPTFPEFATEDRKYDCVNQTCVRRKDGQYDTKAKCQAECKPVVVPPGDDDQKDDKNDGNKGQCGCDSVKVERISTSRLSNSYPDCIDKGVKDIWKWVENIQWNCDDPNYMVEISLANDNGAEKIEPTFPITLSTKGNINVTGTVDVGCRGKNDPQKKQVGAQYRFQIIYIPTNAHVTTCYNLAEKAIPANVIECCQLEEIPTTTTSQSPTVSPLPNGTTTTTTTTPQSGTTTTTTTTTTTSQPDGTTSQQPCPECADGDDDKDDDIPPTEAPGTSTTEDPSTSTTCPPCPTESGTSGGNSQRGKAKSIDNSKPTDSTTTTTTISPNITTTTTTTTAPSSTTTETPSLS
jgi:hypothetical protein